MGCDIHLHTEVKINGKWEHYGHPHVPRNYTLFALMADVRNEGGKLHPVSKPKGMPSDPSLVTRLAFEHYADGHSHSWLSAVELVMLEDAWNKVKGSEWDGSDLEHHFVGYLENNGWAGFTRYPTGNARAKEWIEDVRWVFWFDN